MTHRRLFIGYPIADSLGNDLISHVADEINDVTNKIRWTIPGNFHITAKFIGNLEEALIPQVISILESSIANSSGYEIEINKIAAFPKESSTVLAAYIKPQTQLAKINKLLEDSLVSIGIKKENRSYQPHITLGRSLTPNSCRKVVIKQRLKLHSLVIYESVLKKDGSRYFSLYSCDLA